MTATSLRTGAAAWKHAAAPARPGREARHHVTTALMVVLLAGFAFVALAPRVLGLRVLYVRSGSMTPTMPVGSLALYRPVDATRITPGTVIAFKIPGTGRVVTHRVVRIEDGDHGKVFVTKGDANSAEDPWRVPVTGDGQRMIASVPYLGFVVGYAATLMGRFALLVAAVVVGWLVTLHWLWKRAPDTPVRPTRPVPRALLDLLDQ